MHLLWIIRREKKHQNRLYIHELQNTLSHTIIFANNEPDKIIYKTNRSSIEYWFSLVKQYYFGKVFLLQ